MILKDLAQKIFHKHGFILSIKEENNNVIFQFKDKDLSINIFELASICKEWALDKGFIVSSEVSNNLLSSFSSVRLRTVSDGCLVHSAPVFIDKKEPEAIFKAVSYIFQISK